MWSRVTLAAAVGAAGLAVAAGVTGVAGASPIPSASACPVFPATNVWNKRVDSLPVAANSSTMINAIGAGTGLHPDFGSFLGYGIPYNVVTGKQKKVKVKLGYASQSIPRWLSDPGRSPRSRPAPTATC